MANSIENFEPVFNRQLENLFLERMEGNEEIFVRLMNDEAFRNVAATHLMRAVYKQVREAQSENSSTRALAVSPPHGSIRALTRSDLLLSLSCARLAFSIMNSCSQVGHFFRASS
jgi:hypothetical protein